MTTPTIQLNAAGDNVTMSNGGQSWLFGGNTIAFVVRRNTNGAYSYPLVSLTSASATIWLVGINPSNQVEFWNGGGTNPVSTFTITASDGWCIVVVSKATGTAACRMSKYSLTNGGSWTHENTAITSPNATGNPAGGSLATAADAASGSINDEYGPMAFWTSVLSDVNRETLDDSLNAWVDLAPVSFWRQEATTVDVFGACDQTARTSITAGANAPIEFVKPFFVRAYPASGTLGISNNTTFSTNIDTTALGPKGAIVVFLVGGKQGGDMTGASFSTPTLGGSGTGWSEVIGEQVNAASTTGAMGAWALLNPSSSASIALVLAYTGGSGGSLNSVSAVVGLYSEVDSVSAFGGPGIDNDGGSTTTDTMTNTAGTGELTVGAWSHGSAISSVTSGTLRGAINNMTTTHANGCMVLIEGNTAAFSSGSADSNIGLQVKLVMAAPPEAAFDLLMTEDGDIWLTEDGELMVGENYLA